MKRYWRFEAWENEQEMNNKNPLVSKDFDDHSKMKTFSSEHSYIHEDNPNYVSNYWDITVDQKIAKELELIDDIFFNAARENNEKSKNCVDSYLELSEFKVGQYIQYEYSIIKIDRITVNFHGKLIFEYHGSRYRKHKGDVIPLKSNEPNVFSSICKLQRVYPNLKLYEFSYEGDKDWVFAESEEEALEIMEREVGEIHDTVITEIPNERLTEYYMLDFNETPPDDEEYDEDDYLHGYKIIETYKEYKEKNNFSHYLGSNNT